MSGQGQASLEASGACETVARAAGRSCRRALLRGALPVTVTLAVLGTDAFTKAWAVHQRVGAPVWPMRWAQVRHVTNTGASFGLGAGHPGVVLFLALAATALVGWWAFRARGVLERLALAAVAGGAAGNLVDRLARGEVTDWLHVTWYPATFNVADLAVRGGALVVVGARLVHHRRASNGTASGAAKRAFDGT